MDGAGLFLRVHREDVGLQRLRTALRRARRVAVGVRFASLFFDTKVVVAAGAVAALRKDLDDGGGLSPIAEVTWHGVAGSDDAVAALGTTRRSLTRMPTGRLTGPHALDLGSRGLTAIRSLEWLRGLKKLGIVHLGLQGAALSLERVREVAGYARELGFVQYETVNWALPGHEAQWLLNARQGHPILGIGPSAYGYWPASDGMHASHGASPGTWLQAVDQGSDGRRECRQATLPCARCFELTFGGLRTLAGVDLWAMPTDVREAFHRHQRKGALERLVGQGRLTFNKGRIVAADLDDSDELACQLFD